jgi:hypothetical protein
MGHSKMLRMIARAQARTAASGLRGTHESLGALRAKLSGCKNAADAKGEIASAVKEVREAHAADMRSIGLARADSCAGLGADCSLFSYINGTTGSMDVVITEQNTPNFVVRMAPGRDRNAGSGNWMTFHGVAALDLMIHAGSGQEGAKASTIISALAVGLAAVVIRKIPDMVALWKRLTVAEFDGKIAHISETVESTLGKIERELGAHANGLKADVAGTGAYS